MQPADKFRVGYAGPRVSARPPDRRRRIPPLAERRDHRFDGQEQRPAARFGAEMAESKGLPFRGATSGGFIAIAAAILMSTIRACEARNIATCGSA